MTQIVQLKSPKAPEPRTTTSPIRYLRRKCACGGTTGPDGECAGCRKKRLALQRRATNQAVPYMVPPTLNEVPRSPDQPLDAGVRAFMEPRFGHDFGRVRVGGDRVYVRREMMSMNPYVIKVKRITYYDWCQVPPCSDDLGGGKSP